jgi:hypothetical protein
MSFMATGALKFWNTLENRRHLDTRCSDGVMRHPEVSKRVTMGAH